MIVTLKDLLESTQKLKIAGKKVTLVTGCFDILHSVHLKFLKKAKAQGEVLLVGLEPDERVSQLKGKSRPVNSWQKRAAALVKIPEVDFVFPLPKDLAKRETQQLLIGKIEPQALAVSSHTPNLARKKAIIERYGGKLRVVLLHDPSVSTSKILKDL